MANSISKKLIVIIGILAIVGVLTRISLLHIPALKDYGAQKIYAEKVENSPEHIF